MKTLHFTPKNEIHFTSLLMDLLQPITLRSHWDTQLKVDSYIQPFINIIDLIITLGEQEHTGDWDPSIRIEFHNWDTIETQPGYYTIEIENDTLIIEDLNEYYQEIIHKIPISEIASIELIRN